MAGGLRRGWIGRRRDYLDAVEVREFRTMREKKSYLLVVDASVAQAAGYSTKPTSSCCRDALDSILSICHRLMMSPALSIEWRNHQSGYASRWKATMVAKKKVVFITDSSFCVVVEQAKSLNDCECAALEKDKHLVELAVDGDENHILA